MKSLFRSLANRCHRRAEAKRRGGLRFAIDERERRINCSGGAPRTLIKAEKIVLGRIVGNRPDVLYAVLHVCSDRYVVPADLNVKAALTAVDHVRDLLASVVPSPAARTDAADLGDVFTRAVRMGFGDACNLI